MDLRIREAQPDDAGVIVNILNAVIKTGKYTVFDAPLTAEFEREYITNFPDRGIFHVAEYQPEQEIVGWQSMEPFAPFTHAFDHVGVIGTYVAFAHQRRGVGVQLAQATFEVAHRKGYEKIFTYVRADSPPSLTFYLKLGFRIVGTAQKQAKIGQKYVDEIIIEKLL
jgi:L-amino acid N-acyltransferase YncA